MTATAEKPEAPPPPTRAEVIEGLVRNLEAKRDLQYIRYLEVVGQQGASDNATAFLNEIETLGRHISFLNQKLLIETAATAGPKPAGAKK